MKHYCNYAKRRLRIDQLECNQNNKEFKCPCTMCPTDLAYDITTKHTKVT